MRACGMQWGSLMFEKSDMRPVEKLLFCLVLGAIPPISGFVVAGCGTFALLPEGPFLWTTLFGFLIGILVDVVYLRKWVAGAYSFNLKIWMAVHVFYSIGMLGFFMGVPVFHVILAVPAGLFMGGRLARRKADSDESSRMKRKTRLFTTLVLAAVCVASGAIALVDPYTGSFLQRLLGLHFEVTRWMLAGVIVTGGSGLLALNWVFTGKMVDTARILTGANIGEPGGANRE